MKDESTLQNIEIGLFLDALFQRHGYDFRNYAHASLKRRVLAVAAAANCPRVADLIPKVLHDEGFLLTVLTHLSVPVTEMFRDPPVFKALRETVLPLLASYSRLNIWQAGCATGEEVYSLAILLAEEGLLERTQIYATDINDEALHKAEDGIFPTRYLEEYTRNYQNAGGKATFSDYFTAGNNFLRMQPHLRQKIVFAHHNLVSDGVFCEVHLVLCRNVLIYFDNTLQGRVLQLFHQSLARGGFLCLGTRESLQAGAAASQFQAIDQGLMIFRRKIG